MSSSRQEGLDDVGSSDNGPTSTLRHDDAPVPGAEQVAGIVDLSIHECRSCGHYVRYPGKKMQQSSSTTTSIVSAEMETLSRSEGESRVLSDSLLNVAESLHAQGRREECLEILLRILSRDAENVDALHLQAVCHLDAGEHALALGCLAGALSLDPEHVRSLMRYALIQKDLSKYDDALEMIEKAYRCLGSREDEHVCHAYASILTDAATCEKLRMKQGWEDKYRKAVDICPGYAPGHYNLGVAATEKGNLGAALAYYEKAIELHPEYVEALSNMGVILQNQGRMQECLDVHEKARCFAPSSDVVAKNYAMALTHHGTEKMTQGLVEEAIRLYERAVAVYPTCTEALYNLGVAYSNLDEIDKAIFAYRCTIQQDGGCAEALNNLGVLYRKQGHMELALQSYEAAIKARPNFPQGLNNLAVMYTQQGRASLALNLLRAAIMADAEYAEAWNNLGVLQRDIGDAEEAIRSYRKCSYIEPDDRNAGQNLLLGLNYLYDGDGVCVWDAHATWATRFQALYPPMPQCDVEERIRHKKIKVGYVTPDLFVHSVSFFAEAPICHHDMDLFDVNVYSVCVNPDQKTQRLHKQLEQAGGTWKHVTHLSEQELAELIREDEIDILFDLTGHTANNRLGTFAIKPAPVQVTWIGYPNTTGLTTMDYRITDNICDPKHTTQKFSEELVRLPTCFLCYTPCPEAPDVAPLPADSSGFITFGSFNALAKQTIDVLETWSRILHSVPNSRIVLKNKPFACDSVRQKYWQIFEGYGISRTRVDLLPLARNTEAHLKQYSMIDVCLDPFPYAGTTTTVEALYMGVPCLTMRGKGHAHNVGVSLITCVGLGEEWIADSKSDYISKAHAISGDISALRQLRATLRDAVSSSSLCDVSFFMDHYQEELKNMWKRYTYQ